MSARHATSAFFAAPRALLVTALLVTPGCRSNPAPVETVEPVADAPVSPVAPPRAVAVDTITSPLQMLPAGTIAMFEGKGLARLAEIVERDALAKAVGPMYSLFEGAMTQAFGRDILIPENAEEIGVDPQGSVGVGYVAVGGGAFVSWATVSDRVRFRETVIGAAKRGNVELQTSQIGSVEILRDKYSGVQVVMRDAVAMLAVPMHRDQEGVAEIGRMFATVSISQSLAESGGFKKATFGFNGQDGLGFANIAAFAEHAIELTAGREGIDRAEAAVADARARGESAEIVDSLEANLASEREYQVSRQRRLDARGDLVEVVFAGLPAFGLRVDAKRSGVMMEARAVQPDTAFPRSLVRPMPGPAPILGALKGAPVMVVSGVLEIDSAVDVIDRIARVDRRNGSWSRYVRRMERDFGVNVDTEVRPELDGAFGFAMTWDGESRGRRSGPTESDLGFSAHAKIRDPAKAARILKTFATNFEEGRQRFKPARGANHYVVDVPQWRTVHLSLVGDEVVLSTDAQFGERLGRGGQSLDVGAPGATAVMELPGSSAIWGFDVSLLSAFLLVGQWSNSYFYHDAPTKTSSKAYRKTYKEAMKAKAALDAAQELHVRKQLDVWREIAGPIGFLALSATESDEDVVARGGLFIRATSIGAVIRDGLAGALTFDEKTRSAEVSAARDRLYQLDAKLREMNTPQPVEAKAPARR